MTRYYHGVITDTQNAKSKPTLSLMPQKAPSAFPALPSSLSSESVTWSAAERPHEPGSPRDEPKSSEPRGRDPFFIVVLVILSVLAAVLWFTDAAHQPQGESRVDWPSAESAKP